MANDNWPFSPVTLILSACPDGWTAKSEFSKCYYYLNDTKRTWNESNERCAAIDPDSEATLVSVRSQEENDFVLSLISAYSWIGGTDEAAEGVWRWVNLYILVGFSSSI